MSQESAKQYYLSLTHRVESAHHKPVIIQVLIARETPNLSQSVLSQAMASAVRNAQEVVPGIEVTSAALIARIDLGYMTADEFNDVPAADVNAATTDTVQ